VTVLNDKAYEIGLRIYKEKARGRTLDYVQVFDRKYRRDPVHEAIGRLLDELKRKGIKRAIISVPPRIGKSRLAAIELPTQILAEDPGAEIIVASRTLKLARDHSDKARERLRHPLYRTLFPDTRLRTEATDLWTTTAGGKYQACSVAGTINGFGAHWLIIDDIHKNWAEANNPTQREKIWEWFAADAQTRIHPDGIIVVIATRWHRDDMIGRLMSQEFKDKMRAEGAGKDYDWHVINLPIFAKDNDPIGRAPGECLTTRYSREHFLAIKAAQPAPIWAALYEGTPTVDGGNYIDVTKFAYRNPEEIPINQRHFRYWDLATDNKTSADNSAGARVFIQGDLKKPDGRLWIVNVTAGQWKWPHARSRIAEIGRSEKIVIGFESNGGFRTACDNLKEIAPELYVREITVLKDKLTRALPWISLVNEGKVILVRGDWNNDFITEAESFPIAGEKDDRIDAVSGAYHMAESANSGASTVQRENIREREKFPRRGRLGF
jgi:predicted phage terminase large subunit-like protein